MDGIKCVQDIDTIGQRQYGIDLLDGHNGQATERGDLTPQRSKAATVPADPSIHTISRMGAMWQNDVA
jgi:hypothetical protein